MTDQDLTPEERAAFAALPRRKQTCDLLEEHTVQNLRRRGLLAPQRHHALVLSGPWQGLAAAVVVVMLCGSYLFGQWNGSKQTASLMLAMRDQNSEQLTGTLQQSSVAYLAALAELVNRSGAEPGPQQAQIREVAFNSLYDMADQMTRLAPDDPLVSDILRSFARLEARAQADSVTTPQQKIVWF